MILQRVMALSMGMALVSGVLALASPVGQDSPGTLPVALQGVGITEKLGNAISLDQLRFKNEQGKELPLRSYFSQGKPVVVAMVYYECPSLCNFLLNGLTDTLKGFEWTPGNQFQVVAVSINPTETPDLAQKKKESYLASYGRPEAAQGWHFLTGGESQIQALAQELGFGYKYDEKEKQYAHGAALFVLTPEGKLSRILYGIEFKPRDFRLALVEAASGTIGSVVDRFLLFCYRYDATLRTYSVYLFNVMRVAGALTALVLVLTLGLVWRRQWRAQE